VQHSETAQHQLAVSKLSGSSVPLIDGKRVTQFKFGYIYLLMFPNQIVGQFTTLSSH